jgi:hypothetical protein
VVFKKLMEVKSMRSKGQVALGAVPTLVITLVVIGIVLGLGAMILQQFQNNIADGSAVVSNAENATQAGILGIATFADFQSVIAIVLVAAVILGLVGLIAFAGRTV